MFKSLAVASAVALAGAPAIAGPYANVENNAGWTGTNYGGSVTDLHVGYEGDLGEVATWYVQGGGSYVAPDGAASDTVPSGKAGISVAATQALNIYGEVSFMGSGNDDIDRSYGGKVGAKYMF